MMKAFLQNQRQGNSESGGLKPIIEAYEGGETARHQQERAAYLDTGCPLDKKEAPPPSKTNQNDKDNSFGDSASGSDRGNPKQPQEVDSDEDEMKWKVVNLSLEGQVRERKDKAALEELIAKNLRKRAGGGKGPGFVVAVNRDPAAVRARGDQLASACQEADVY
jgi:hypothetical protein